MPLSCDPATLVKAAKCFPCVPKSSRRAVRAYLLCQLARVGVGKNLIPATAQYSGVTPEFDLTVQAQTSYTITWGNNDLSMTLCGVSYPSTGVGTNTVVFTAACTVMQFFGTFAGTTVTARVVQNRSIIPIPTGFTFVITNGSTVTAAWDNPHFLLVTYTELWTSTDGITYSLASTVNFPTSSTTVAAPAAGATLYGKIRWCGPTTPCGAFSSAIVLNGRVADWAARVVTNGGAAPSAGTLAALNTFVSSLITAGIDSKIFALNPYAPDNLIACLTPLYKAFGNDPWTNNGPFVAGDLTINGLAGNGTTKYLDTGVNASLLGLGNNQAGFSLYCSVGNTTTKSDIGSSNGGTLNTGIDLFFTTHGARGWSGGSAVTPDTANILRTGFHSINRISNTSLVLYNASSTIPFAVLSQNNALENGLFPNFNIFVHASDLSGAPNQVSNRRYSFFAIHPGFTSTQDQALFNAVQALRVAFGGGFV